MDHLLSTSAIAAVGTSRLVLHRDAPHPDDETRGAGSILVAKDRGLEVVLDVFTGGEEGELHNLPEASRSEIREIRLRELGRSSRILRIDRVNVFGYRDSGMAGADSNDHPLSFHRASLEEAVERKVGILRAERPAVVITDGPDGTYGHPDHVKTHEVTMTALRRLHDEEGWQPDKVYWEVMPASRIESVLRNLRADGREAPTALRYVGVAEDEITTVLTLTPEQLQRKRAALKAYVSQNPPDPLDALHPYLFDAMGATETYRLVGGRLFAERGPGLRTNRETDLFAGIQITRNVPDPSPGL